MINLLGLALGIVVGLIIARRKGGNRLDLLHYATVFGLIGFVIGVFAMLVLPAPA